MKEILGFFFVIVATIPMGFAEGRLITLNEHYTISNTLPLVLLYFLSVAIYLIGFMQIPLKVGYIVGIWEIATVTIAVTTAIISNHAIKLDREYVSLYALLIVTTYLLGWTADRIFAKAGI